MDVFLILPGLSHFVMTLTTEEEAVNTGENHNILSKTSSIASASLRQKEARSVKALEAYGPVGIIIRL